MSTISERAERGAATPERAPTCQAVTPWLGVEWVCGEPAAGRYRRACVHEHVRDGWLCQRHVDSQTNGFCRTCDELDGGLAHECPITLAPIAEVPA